MTNCPVCGTPVNDGLAFCPECGTKLAAAPAPAASAPAVAPEAPQPQYQQAQYQQPQYQQPQYQQPQYQQPQYQQAQFQQPQYQQGQYQQAQFQQPQRMPRVKLSPKQVPLDSSRNFWIVILLDIITFGIYGMWLMGKITDEVNKVAGPYDGVDTMNFGIMMSCFAGITFGIYPLVWYTKFCNRIGGELQARGISYGFSGKTFWGWSFFGVLLFGIGPLVFLAKLIKAMNLLNNDYNMND